MVMLSRTAAARRGGALPSVTKGMTAEQLERLRSLGYVR
jgi:hypothetical protein